MEPVKNVLEEAEVRALRPPRKRRFIVLGAVALAALAGVGIYALATRGHESTDDARFGNTQQRACVRLSARARFRIQVQRGVELRLDQQRYRDP